MVVHNDDAVNNEVTTPAVEKPTETVTMGGGTSGFARFFGGIKRYLREVIAELKKTNWPSRDELTKSTVVVILTIVVVAVFLSVCDWAVAHIMSSKAIGIVPPATGR